MATTPYELAARVRLLDCKNYRDKGPLLAQVACSAVFYFELNHRINISLVAIIPYTRLNVVHHSQPENVAQDRKSAEFKAPGTVVEGGLQISPPILARKAQTRIFRKYEKQRLEVLGESAVWSSSRNLHYCGMVVGELKCLISKNVECPADNLQMNTSSSSKLSSNLHYCGMMFGEENCLISNHVPCPADNLGPK